MKKKFILLVIVLLITIVLFGIVVFIVPTNSNQEQPEPTPQNTDNFITSIDKTISQSHYQLILKMELIKTEEIVTGTYQFDMDHGKQIQTIDATVIQKDVTTIWHSHIDEFDNKYYYEDATQGIVVPDQADVEYIFELMRNASNVTDNSFSLTASSVAETLDSTTMRYLSGVSGDNTVVVDNDVVFTYEKEVDIFKKLSSTFTINGGQQVTVSYELTTLTDTVA